MRLDIDPTTRRVFVDGKIMGDMEVVEYLTGTEPPVIVTKEAGGSYSVGGNSTYGRAQFHIYQCTGEFWREVRRGISYLKVEVHEVVSPYIRPDKNHLNGIMQRLVRRDLIIQGASDAQ